MGLRKRNYSWMLDDLLKPHAPSRRVNQVKEDVLLMGWRGFPLYALVQLK